MGRRKRIEKERQTYSHTNRQRERENIERESDLKSMSYAPFHNTTNLK